VQPDFAGAVLNSLSAHIAVLDGRGRIVAVNDAWRRFARANGAAGMDDFVGASYVTACEAAVRSSADRDAQGVLEGLRAVLCGERAQFSAEYPCHSPGGAQRWFTVHVTCFVQAGATYVVTRHEDITARRKAEDALRKSEAHLREVLEREQSKARTDELTGLTNRRHFFEVSEQLVSVARRYGSPLSVLLFDIDHFKKINDTHGHHAGDEVLQAVARLLRESMRQADVIARYGGEEFIATLPNTRAEEAFAAAEHLRKTIAGRRQAQQGVVIRVTISVGIAALRPPGESLARLIQRADEALYAAKSAGRDCSRIAPAA
jgi:diguanylate cyclase (GGDEF)-like protein